MLTLRLAARLAATDHSRCPQLHDASLGVPKNKHGLAHTRTAACTSTGEASPGADVEILGCSSQLLSCFRALTFRCARDRSSEQLCTRGRAAVCPSQARLVCRSRPTRQSMHVGPRTSVHQAVTGNGITPHPHPTPLSSHFCRATVERINSLTDSNRPWQTGEPPRWWRKPARLERTSVFPPLRLQT